MSVDVDWEFVILLAINNIICMLYLSLYFDILPYITQQPCYKINYYIEVVEKIVFFFCLLLISDITPRKNSDCGQSWRRGTKCACKLTSCGFDPHSRRCNIYLHLCFIYSLWCRGESADEFRTQHAMPSEIGG